MRKIYFILLSIMCLKSFSVEGQVNNGHLNENLIPFENKDHKWGYLDAATNKITIPAKYDYVYLFINGLGQVKNNNPADVNRIDGGFTGYIDTLGNEIYPPTLTAVYDVKKQNDSIINDYRIVYLEDGSKGVLSLQKGWIIKPAKYDNFKFYESNQYLIDDKIFVFNEKIYKAPSSFKIVSVDFENQYFTIIDANDDLKKGICKWDGTIILKPNYFEIKFNRNTKTFLVSSIKINFDEKSITSTEVTNHLYNTKGGNMAVFKSQYATNIIKEFDIATYEMDKKYFSINLRTGVVIVEKKEKKNRDYVFKSKGELFGIKDENEKIIVQPIFSNLEIVSDYYVIAKKYIKGKNSVGVIDKKGKEIIPFEYDNIFYENSGSLVASKNGKYGCINFYGEIRIDFLYDYEFRFKNGFAKVHTDSGFGIVDGFGKVIVPAIYNDISIKNRSYKILMANLKYRTTEQSYFSVNKNNKYGLYDDKGNVIIPIEFGYVSFEDDENLKKGWVKIEDELRQKKGLVNINTKETIAPKYSTIEIMEEVIKVSTSNNNIYKYSLLNRSGKKITIDEYEEMDFNYGYFKIAKNNLHGLMNTKAEVIVSLKYDYI